MWTRSFIRRRTQDSPGPGPSVGGRAACGPERLLLRRPRRPPVAQSTTTPGPSTRTATPLTSAPPHPSTRTATPLQTHRRSGCDDGDGCGCGSGLVKACAAMSSFVVVIPVEEILTKGE